MSEFLVYLIKANFCFTVLYVAFYLFFRKLTFHHINRFLLLTILLLSLSIPMLKMEVNTFLPIEITQTVNAHFTDLNFDNNNFSTSNKNTPPIISFWNVALLFYWMGFVYFCFRLCKSIHELWCLKRGAKKITEGGVHFVKTNVSTIFSFFNFIFLPKNKTEDYAAAIIEHEKAHARFKHSLDLMIVEIFSVFCWFNPLIYFYKKSIRLVHEFQADEAVLRQQGLKKSHYLQLMLQQLTLAQSQKLYSYFNVPSIRKRVEMITNTPSNILFSLKYLLFLPVLSVLFMAFIKPTNSIQVFNNNLISKEGNKPSFTFPILNHSFDDVSAPFGIEGRNPITEKIELHGGIDFSGYEGTPIIAAATGEVRTAMFENDWGNYVVITHANGFETWYAHLKDILISKNQTVEQGTIIGHLGSTGVARNHHLHFEIRQDGKRLNPLDLLK